MSSKPVDGNHALLIGALYGGMIKVVENVYGWDRATVLPIIDKDRDYLNGVRVVLPSGTYLIEITKESNATEGEGPEVHGADGKASPGEVGQRRLRSAGEGDDPVRSGTD